MLLRRLRSVSPGYGNYCAVTIPKVWVEEMNLHANDEVIMEKKDKSIIVTPVAPNPTKNQVATEAEITTRRGGING